MRSYRNPFRYRTSEQESRQGLARFLRTFGPGALDLLPETLWDRLVVIQSAPGAGKTSLLRTFTAEALHQVAAKPDDYAELHERMTNLGALAGQEVKVLGIRLALKKNYRAIDDLGLPPEAATKVFFLLLDAHIVRTTIDALTKATGEENLTKLQWEAGDAGEEALKRLGGNCAADLLAWSREAERSVLDQLDSVLPPRADQLRGHHAPYSIQALSRATFTHGGEPLGQRPLLMFDEGQEVGEDRRRALLDVLGDRDLELFRWYAERYQALSADAMIADGEPDRTYVPVRLEENARALSQSSHRGHRTRRFEGLLTEIANRRALNSLSADADEERPFSEFVVADFDRDDDDRAQRAVEHLQGILVDTAQGSPRYDEWLELARGWRGYDGAILCRAMQILIARDKQRGQDTLFAVRLTADEYKRLALADIREAAGLFLRRERLLPFYAGPERLAKLASENIEQHITICGQLYEELLAQVTLGHPLGITALRQDATVRQTSETLWRNIPMRRAEGRSIQQLLLHIAQLCRDDTYRDTAPYAPGVTGTAISMRDREKLIDPGWRARTPGADALHAALAGAIGHNLLRAELDRPVKGDRWMVLYLNRLLCARFGLPLGYGGFRERPISVLCEWMGTTVADTTVAEASIQEQLKL